VTGQHNKQIFAFKLQTRISYKSFKSCKNSKFHGVGHEKKRGGGLQGRDATYVFYQLPTRNLMPPIEDRRQQVFLKRYIYTCMYVCMYVCMYEAYSESKLSYKVLLLSDSTFFKLFFHIFADIIEALIVAGHTFLYTHRIECGRLR